MIEFLKIHYKRLLAVLLVAATLMLSLCFCSSEDMLESEIVAATVKNNRKTVKVEVTLSDEDAELYKGEKLYLLSLESNNVNDGAQVVGEAKAKSKMTFNIKLDKQKEGLISSALALARDTAAEGASTRSYELLTELEYISNPSMLATKNYRPAEVSEIKGLESPDLLDCSSLGAVKTLIEVEINELLLPKYKDGAINYIFDGCSYYFDGDRVAMLDKQIKEASSLGLRVYLRTVISSPDDDEDYVKELYFSNAKKSAEGFAINADSSVAMGYLRAFYSFLAERYNNEDALAVDIVIGRGVNNYNKNCSAASAEEFEAAYFAWVRVAHNIFQSHNKNSTVYVSVDNNLRIDGTQALGAKVFLSHMASYAKLSGQYDFAVALSLSEGEDLGDILSGQNSDLSLINANSFASFCELMTSDELLCSGKERTMIIDSLALPDDISEQNRAAYYAYTYYKAREAGFDALIYSESGEGCDVLNANQERRDLFYAFLLCGSDGYSQLYDYLGKIKSADIPKLADYVSTTLFCEQEIPCEISSSAQSNKKDFPAKLYKLHAVGSAYNADVSTVYSPTSESEARTLLTMYSDLEGGTAALTLGNISAADMIESGYIGIAMYTDLVTDVELVITRGGEETCALYIGEARVGSVEKTYYFNISEFTDNIKASDELTVSLRIPRYAESREPTLTVSDIALYGSSGNGSSTVVAVVVVALSTLAVCGLLFLLTQRRKRNISQDEE